MLRKWDFPDPKWLELTSNFNYFLATLSFWQIADIVNNSDSSATLFLLCQRRDTKGNPIYYNGDLLFVIENGQYLLDLLESDITIISEKDFRDNFRVLIDSKIK